jgi:hypothetical protein
VLKTEFDEFDTVSCQAHQIFTEFFDSSSLRFPKYSTMETSLIFFENFISFAAIGTIYSLKLLDHKRHKWKN